jgi:YHS domain-containing protein
MVSTALTGLRIKFLKILLAIVLSILPVTNLFAADSVRPVNKDKSGIAIKGYDPVAYFVENRAVKGKEEFEYLYEGTRWRFSSAAHRDLFTANPERYMPQYGGF